MPIFSYRALSVEGSTVEGITDAVDEKNAVEKVRDLGLILVSISVQVPRLRRGIHLSSRNNLLLFTTELSALIAAGLPLDRSLIVISQAAENNEMKQMVQAIVKSIREGHSFSDALEHHSRMFPRFYTNMVRAGEAGGVLQPILGKLKEFLESSQEVKETVVSAIIYPIILLITGGISIGILITFVIPRFAVIFADTGKVLPVSTQFLLALSSVISGYWWVLLSAFVLLLLAGRTYLASDKGRRSWDGAKLAVLGKIVRTLETARFCRTLGTLLGGGVPLLEAITNAREVIGNRIVAAAIGPVVQGIREGRGVGATLAGTRAFPPLAVSMMKVGEETGQLEAMLLQIASLYEQGLKQMVKRFVSLLEPILIVTMGLIVGFVVVSMLTAVFSITDLPI